MSEVADAKIWSDRAYLSRQGKEILSRSARRIAINQPDHVDDPEDPSLTECLVELQDRSDSEFVDAALVQHLLERDLTYEEIVLWLLHEHCGLDVAELTLADAGMQHPGQHGVNTSLQRSIKRVLDSAERKLEA
jgi:hypothetical protein